MEARAFKFKNKTMKATLYITVTKQIKIQSGTHCYDLFWDWRLSAFFFLIPENMIWNVTPAKNIVNNWEPVALFFQSSTLVSWIEAKYLW